MITTIQRVENVALTAMIFVAFVHFGFPWWTLFGMFLVYDLSALAYLKDARVGAVAYNLVHNYTAPALLGLLYLFLSAADQPAWALGFIAGTWGFHVAVDRALGYGLKLTSSFQDTHLGRIGRK